MWAKERKSYRWCFLGGSLRVCLCMLKGFLNATSSQLSTLWGGRPPGFKMPGVPDTGLASHRPLMMLGRYAPSDAVACAMPHVSCATYPLACAHCLFMCAMNNNTLHYGRRLHSSFGIIKVPFTLSQPVDGETVAEHLHGLCIKGCMAVHVVRVKLCTPTTGWVHLKQITT